MVNVEVKRQSDFLQEVLIHNHAEYGEHGQDLVCAGVSSIAVGMLNVLDQMTKHDVCELVMKEAYVKLSLKQRDETAELLLEAMLIQLKTLEENYHNYISIHDQEV